MIERLRQTRVGMFGLAMACLITASGTLAIDVGGPAASGAGPPIPSSLSVPLSAAVTTSTGSWAVVAMGQAGVPLNTFWELFFRAPGADSWNLVTPPDVADNGGLSISVAPSGEITAGFESSQLLRFSPLAVSADAGAKWTPALLPSSLLATPDALATSGDGGPAVAIVRRSGQQVVVSSGPLLKWRSLAGSRGLANGAASHCNIDGLDAVAIGSSASPLVGTGCRGQGQVGVFSRVASHWKLVGPSLGGRLAGASTQILRLDTTAGALSALVAARTRGHTSLVGMWRSAVGAWSPSEPLEMGSSQEVIGSSIGSNGDQIVLLSTQRSGGELEIAKGPGQPWSSLPSPPSGTVTVAYLPDGSANAFSVSGSHLKIFNLAAGQRTWTVLQSTIVPIAYGSS